MIFGRGFTLVELLSVIVIIGILASAVVSFRLPISSAQLQASRDSIVTVFYLGQQKAMIQNDPVRIIANTNSIDIRRDTDGDGSFTDESSLNIGGVQYPISLLPSQSLTTGVYDFNRLGKTTNAGSLTLAQGADNVTITVSPTGYVY